VISKASCLLLQLQALCFRPAQQGGTSGLKYILLSSSNT
jgi:hypothetical protein